MPDWNCHVCGTEVSWGTPVCPLCGSALEWQEVDEDEPDAYLYTPTWGDGRRPHGRRRRGRAYQVGAIVFGVLLLSLGVAAKDIAKRDESEERQNVTGDFVDPSSFIAEEDAA